MKCKVKSCKYYNTSICNECSMKYLSNLKEEDMLEVFYELNDVLYNSDKTEKQADQIRKGLFKSINEIIMDN